MFKESAEPRERNFVLNDFVHRQKNKIHRKICFGLAKWHSNLPCALFSRESKSRGKESTEIKWDDFAIECGCRELVSNREGVRYRGTIDIYGKNHKLQKTNDLWKITFKADEDPLDRITVLSCYSQCGHWMGGSIHIFARVLIRNVDSQAHPNLLSQNLHF